MLTKMFVSNFVYSLDFPISILPYGVWNSTSGIILETEDELWERRKDLQGLQFKAATLLSAPYVTYLAPNKVTVFNFVVILRI